MNVGRMSKVSGHAQRYGATVRWLISDAVRMHPWRSAIVLGGSFLGTLSHGVVFGLLLTYSRALESNAPLHLGSRQWLPRDEQVFFLTGLATFALLLGSAGLIYFSKWQIVQLVVAHYRHCSEQVLRLYGARPDASLRPSSYRQVLRALKKRTSIDAKLCGKSLRILLGAIVPLLTVSWTIGVMFWIEAWASLGVLALVGLFLGLYYAVNRRVVQNQRRLEEVKPQARAQWLEHVERTKGHARWTERQEEATRALYAGGEVRTSLSAYGRRLLATVHAELVGNVLLALGIAGVLIYLGSRALGQSLQWSEFFAFIITARINMSAVRSVFNSLTGFSKLYPFVRRYYDFVLSVQANASAMRAVSHLKLAVASNRLPVGIEEMDVQPGDRIAILTPVEINRYTVFYFADCLASSTGVRSGDLVRSIYFVHRDQATLGRISIRELAHLPAGTSLAELDRMFNGVNLGQRLRSSGFDDVEQEYRRREIKSMGDSLRHELLLAAAAASPAGVLILDHDVLAQIDEDARARWLDVLADRVVLIHCGQRTESVGLVNEKAICVSTGEGIVGLGTLHWLREHEQLVMAALEAERGKDEQDPLYDDAEQLLDEED